MLVVDALGFSEQIRTAGADGLAGLVDEVECQFHRFRAKVPHRAMMVGRKSVIATGEYATLRLNDMFVLHATRPLDDLPTRFLLCASMLFQQMLLAGQIPRGGMGFGPIYRRKDLLIGEGFLDAYAVAEKRSGRSRHVCAVLASPSFVMSMPNTRRAYQLLCFYEGRFYVHPWGLIDPQMGTFDAGRILGLLEKAGANDLKLEATAHFLENLEDYEAAKRPGSRTRVLREVLGEPWHPSDGMDAEPTP